MPRFLLVEDSEADAVLIERGLRREWPECDVEWLASAREFEARMRSPEPFDLVLCDFNLPAWDVFAAMKAVKAAYPTVPFIVLSGALGEETAVELMRNGAEDVILKSQPGRVAPSIRRALKEREMTAREEESKRREEDAIRAREETLALVSHDLRNPLSTILLLSQIHLDRLDKQPLGDEARSAEIQLAFSKIRRAGGFMRTLIEDLLIHQSAAQGELVISPASVDVARFLREICEMFEPIAREKGVRIDRESLIERSQARFDADRLFQALSNVVSNAIKFTPKGGVVSIRLLSYADALTISVTDSGPGVPEPLREKIFEKYFQASGRDRRGFGLGLFIARTIVRNHGGDLRIVAGESRGPQGACFRITLPQAGTSTGIVRKPETATGSRVLFVDDDADLREVVGDELRRRGFVIDEVGSLAEAGEHLAEGRQLPDLILIDYSLPDGKGTDFVDVMKARGLDGKIPVVLLSGEINIAELAAVAGLRYYVGKPPSLNELVKKITQLTEGAGTD